jgi:hypothetical protein
MKSSKKSVAIIIDKLTNSLIETTSGRSVTTIVLPFTVKEKNYRPKDWKFDWKTEASKRDRKVYQLLIEENRKEIQGLVSLADLGDHYFLHLIESSHLNFSKMKKYSGVAGNLFAFGCLQSKKSGYEGILAFYSKTNLINHYIESLQAKIIRNNKMMLDEKAAKDLINKYFKNSI